VVDVITPEAPLGRALAGRVQGEDLELRLGARQRELYIARVC
jgi:transcription elongation GreA/GreB family factor